MPTKPKAQAAAKAPAEAKPAGPTRRRPTAEDTTTTFPAMFSMMEDGSSFTSACKHFGIDTPSARKFIDTDPELAKAYEWAVEGRGDYYGEQVMNTAAGVVTGKIKPDVGRVAMEGFKWGAARMNRKRWGDKLGLEHEGGMSVTLNVSTDDANL